MKFLSQYSLTSFGPPHKNLSEVALFDRFAYVSSVQALSQGGGSQLTRGGGEFVGGAMASSGKFEDWDSSVRLSLVLSEFVSHLRFAPPKDGVAEVKLVNDAGGEPASMVSVRPTDDTFRFDNLKGLPAVKLLATLRKERLAEIVAQMSDVEQMLVEAVGLTVLKFPFTFELMLVGTGLANVIVQRFKHELNVRRPSQLDPLVAPIIPVPGHASFPGAHGMQSEVAALLLFITAWLGDVRLPREFLTLPDQIALNRVIAGLHYPADSEEGLRLGQRLALWIVLSAFPGTDADFAMRFEAMGLSAARGWVPIPNTPKLPLLHALAELASREFSKHSTS